MTIQEPIYVDHVRRTPEMLTGCLYDLILKVREVQPSDESLGWTIGDTMAQSIQELGEFSEQVMISEGKLQHKEAEYNGVALEAADVIICVMDAYVKQLPNESSSSLLQKLSNAMDKKSVKWIEKVEKQMADKAESVTK